MIDVALQPILVLHIIWMHAYKGAEEKIYAAGFKNPSESGWGAEIFNYRAVRGRCYGHVEAMPRKIKGQYVDPQLHIEKLGAAVSAEKVSGVLVVWTAPDPRRPGRTVVGWYKSATVYRYRQHPTGSLARSRTFKGEVCSFRVEAAAEDCVLLDPERRAFMIPPRKKGERGLPGRFGAFYPAEHKDGPHDLEKALRSFVESGGKPPATRSSRSRPPVDVEHNKEVEEAAIKHVCTHFRGLDYDVDDRQKDNLGYDLFAIRGEEALCIEVKGRSGREIAAEFSRNEYEKIVSAQRGRFDCGAYRICIVTSALTKPLLHHFIHWPDNLGSSGEWTRIDGTARLLFKEVTAAKATGEPVARRQRKAARRTNS